MKSQRAALKMCPFLEDLMIYCLTPSVQRKIWGGKNLESLKNIQPIAGKDPVGETWEISTHHEGPSLFRGEPLTLSLPYLVKLIDTGDELSVQVHPSDEYANAKENSSGKTECWLILAAERGSGIYLGLKKGVTRESFLSGLEKKANMSLYLNFYEVSPGDFFYVPAGTIHAIGRGILMAEVQQNSGITYRVWDWNRLDSNGNPRELHVEKSLDVINFEPEFNTPDFFRFQSELFLQRGKFEIVTHESFKFSLINLKKDEQVVLNYESAKRPASIMNLQGRLSANSTYIDSYSAALMRDENKVVLKAISATSVLLIE